MEQTMTTTTDTTDTATDVLTTIDRLEANLLALHEALTLMSLEVDAMTRTLAQPQPQPQPQTARRTQWTPWMVMLVSSLSATFGWAVVTAWPHLT